MDKTSNRAKLPFSRKITYSIGQLTDSIGFNVFYFFFLYFLTDFAGIKPSVAGSISLIAILWDAVSDPIVGHISDNLKSKYGRRRPLMLAGCIPYGICTFLLFNNIDLGGNAKFYYFLAAAILFWTSYKTYVIPFSALGAELTDDFNERTSIRAWASVVMYAAVLIASAAPPMILGKTMEAGFSQNQAWNIVGGLFGLIIIAAALFCWNFTRGGEIKIDWEKQQAKKENLFKNYLSVLKLKPVKYLAITVICMSLVNTIISSGIVYLMTNVLEYSPERQSSVFVLLTLLSILWLPVINLLSQKLDKKTVYVLGACVSSAFLIGFGLIGFDSYGLLVAYLFGVQFGISGFWTLYMAMMYDISELDEFITGKRREGTITALLSFCQKCGAAIATWLTGMLLTVSGYDAAAAMQSETAEQMIRSIVTFVPGILGVVTIIFALLYPLTGKRFTLLVNALEAKRTGREYSTDGFEKLL